MKLIELHDHALQDITIVDASGRFTSLKIGFKAFNKTQKKRLKTLIFKEWDNTSKLQAILVTNIALVDEVQLLDSELTSSIESNIIPSLVASNPYFETLLEKFIQYLNSDFKIDSYKKQNLYDLGKYQAEVDFDLIDKELDKQKEILEKYGSLIAFPDQPKIKEIKHQILFSSNRDIYKIFLSLRKWTGEFGQIDNNLLIQLSLEYGYRVRDIIDYMSIIYSSYLEHKPKESYEN